MSKLPFLITLLYFVNHTKAQQNLVLNPSFEDTLSYDWSLTGHNTLCEYWTEPGIGSSDYYSAIFPNGNTIYSYSCISLENYGCATAFDGLASVGSYVEHDSNWIIEYIQGELSERLEKNSIYCFSAWITLCDSSTSKINNIEVSFSQNLIDFSGDVLEAPLPIQKKFSFSTDEIKTHNWQKVEYFFIANGEEKFFIIGELDDLSSRTILPINGAHSLTFCSSCSIYQFDKVSISKCNLESMIPNICTPNGDGINDLWTIPTENLSFEFQIFNRWGSTVYSSRNGESSWDPHDHNDGVYFYVISFQESNIFLKGTIQVVH